MKSKEDRKKCRNQDHAKLFLRHYIAPGRCSACPDFLRCVEECSCWPVYRAFWGGVVMQGVVKFYGEDGHTIESAPFLLLARTPEALSAPGAVDQYLLVRTPKVKRGPFEETAPVPGFIRNCMVFKEDVVLYAQNKPEWTFLAAARALAVTHFREWWRKRWEEGKVSLSNPATEKPESISENRKAEIEKLESKSAEEKAPEEKQKPESPVIVFKDSAARFQRIVPPTPDHPKRAARSLHSKPFPEALLADKWERRFVSLARTVAGWSKDPSTQVGAVIFRPDKTIAALGYNGLPRGVHDLPERLENRSLKYSGTIHAEMNAILSCKDPDLRGYGIAVWPLPPCDRCMAHIIQAGIRYVLFPGFKDAHESAQRWAMKAARAIDLLSEVEGVAHRVLLEEGGSDE